MKHVCITTGIFPPDIGGPASYVPKIAAELVKRKIDVSVVCLADHISYKTSPGYDYPVVSILRSMFKPLRFILTVWSIWKSARNADLLYVNGLPLESALAGFLRRIPQVHKIVGDYAWEKARNQSLYAGTLDEYQKAKKSFRLRLMDIGRSFPLRFARAVIVPSQYLGRIVAGWGVDEKKIQTIYNSCDRVVSEELYKARGREKVIVTVGRLVPWKGMDGIIELLSQIDGYQLQIIGDGPLKISLIRKVETLGLRNRVMFTGSISADEVFQRLKRARLFVLNSSYEGLPHVVLEAMAAGTPVIASDAGGTGEVVIDRSTGLLVPLNDPNALKWAMQELLINEALAVSLCKGSYEYMRSKFSYDSMIDKTFEVLHRTSRRGDFAEKHQQASRA